MEKEELYDLLHKLCKLSYIEGRQHQFNDDFPDVGMFFKEDFKDTKTFKILKDNKGRMNL